MKITTSLMLILLLASHAFGDSTSEEVQVLRDKVKQLEEKEEIEELKIQIKKLEERQANSTDNAVRSPARIRPFIGAAVGGLGGNSTLSTIAGAGINFGVNGKHLGSSLSYLIFEANNRWLVSFMLNIYGRIPILNHASVEIANVKLGGGVSRNNSYYSYSGTGYQLDGGINYWLGAKKKFSIGADIIYLFFNPKRWPSSKNENIDLNTIVALVTLNYHFR